MAMASLLSTLDGGALLLLSLLLPLRLFSLSFRPCRRLTPTRSLLVLVSAAVLVVSIYAFSDPAGLENKDVETISEVEKMRHEMETEIQDLKEQIIRLGSILEENTKKLNVKTEILEEDNKIIEAMERDIQYLINEQDNIKKSLTSSNLDNEVQLLHDESQKVNSNIKKMESLAKDAEKKLETLNSEIKKIENIISEQWIQIRQFEQAFQLTKIMASKVEKRNNPNEWSAKSTYKKVLQISEAIFMQYVEDINTVKSLLMEASSSFISHANYHFNIINKVAHKYFHVGFRLLRRIKFRYNSDKTVPDTFFLSCSASKNCFKHFRSIKSLAHKCHQQVNDFVNRLIEST